jgi:hypothetical protein
LKANALFILQNEIMAVARNGQTYLVSAMGDIVPTPLKVI